MARAALVSATQLVLMHLQMARLADVVHVDPVVWLPSKDWQSMTGMRLHACRSSAYSAELQHETVKQWHDEMQVRNQPADPQQCGGYEGLRGTYL